ncbi:unnamed protein product [Amoebophrya sp. A25]|nr:unnamed protein product [Amoebophrya sp. A25]|eukprot:GSA25T00009884001.1
MLKQFMLSLAFSAEGIAGKRGGPHTGGSYQSPSSLHGTTNQATGAKMSELVFERMSLYPLDIASVNLAKELDLSTFTDAAAHLFAYYEKIARPAQFRVHHPQAREEFFSLDAGGRRSQFFQRWQRFVTAGILNQSPEGWDHRGEMFYPVSETAVCANPFRTIGLKEQEDGPEKEREETESQVCCSIDSLLRAVFDDGVSQPGAIVERATKSGDESAKDEEAVCAAVADAPEYYSGRAETASAMNSTANSDGNKKSGGEGTLDRVRDFSTYRSAFLNFRKRIKQLTKVYLRDRVDMSALRVQLLAEALPAGGGVRSHVHTGVLLAGQFFSDAGHDEQDVVLILEDPRAAQPPFGRAQNQRPLAGQVILFPPWVPHGTAWSLLSSRSRRKNQGTSNYEEQERVRFSWTFLVYEDHADMDWDADATSAMFQKEQKRLVFPAL